VLFDKESVLVWGTMPERLDKPVNRCGNGKMVRTVGDNVGDEFTKKMG
jgi:hypothetical protein